MILLSAFMALMQSISFPGPGVKGYAGGGGGGPATYDAVSNGKCDTSGVGTQCTSGTTLTFSHTTGSGSNRALDVFCVISGPSGTVQPAISSITHAGSQNLSATASTGGNYKIHNWALASGTQPTSGANNIVVVLAASLAANGSILHCAGVSTSGVDQASQYTDSGDGASGSDTTAEWSTTTNGSNDLGIVAACNGTSIGTSTNATVRFDATDDGAGACNTLGIATFAATVTSGVWTVGSDTWLTLTCVKKGG